MLNSGAFTTMNEKRMEAYSRIRTGLFRQINMQSLD